MDFKTRRINHFKKNLVDLAELELKHARVSKKLHHVALSLLNVTNAFCKSNSQPACCT